MSSVSLSAVVLSLLALVYTAHGFDSTSVCTSFKYHYSCAIRESDLRVRCWHHNSGEVREAPLEQQFLAISCKGRELCGVLHDGSLATTMDLWPDATGSEYTSIHTSGGKLVCWGERGTAFFESQFPDEYKAISIAESSCLEEGSCSIEDYDTRTQPMCAIRIDGTLQCCCGSVSFMSNIPDSRYKFKDVSVSDMHACGVLVEGGIICWGDGANGKLLAPNIPKGSGGAGPAALTILEDGQIQSGSLVYTDTSPGSDEDGADVEFVSVAATTDVTCGLLWNGVTACWSYVTDTQLEVSSPGCAMEAISLDGYVACGRLLSSDDNLVPSAATTHERMRAAVARTHTNETFIGESNTGVFCWQAFPENLVGLERPAETWDLEERRVPLDIRPPLHALAVCMGLPQREASYDRTRGEALAIALSLSLALAFSAYRLVILRRFGDFSWAITVAEHMTFWFGFVAGLFDLISQFLFVFMDLNYVSFRTLYDESSFGYWYIEAEQPFVPLSLASIAVACFSLVVFLYCSWVYSKDEYGKIDLRSPMAIAKRRFLVSAVVLMLVDVPQMVIIGIYTQTMVEADLRPSATAIFSAICCCLGPVYMVVKNYFRAKNAPNKPQTEKPQDKADMIFGDLAAKGAGAFGGDKPARKGGKPATSSLLAHKMFGKPSSKKYQAGSPARVAPLGGANAASFRRHQPPGGSLGPSLPRHNSNSAVIAALAAKKTQARIKQLAGATSMKNLMRTQSERRKHDDRQHLVPKGRGGGRR